MDALENDVPIDSDKKIGVSNYEEASINGTPSILEIENATITANISGIDDCLTYINEQRIKQN